MKTEKSKIKNVIKWTKQNPVKAGLIGISSLVAARAVGFSRIVKFAVSTGAAKAVSNHLSSEETPS